MHTQSTTTSSPEPAADSEDPGARAPSQVLPGFRHSNTWIFATMLLSAIASLVASFTLSIDALKIAADPGVDLTCNINSVLNCGIVGASDQAALFGFPNAFLGMMLEPVVMTIAVAGLVGVKFPRWFMATAQGIYFLGLIFAYWLFAQSMFSIGALCPWCLVITVGTTLVFMTLLHYNILHNNLYLPPRLQKRAMTFVRSDADAYLTVGWILALATAILAKYGTAVFGG